MLDQATRTNSPQLTLDDHMRRTALLTQLAIEFRETLDAATIIEQALRVLGGHLAHDGASVIVASPHGAQHALTMRAGVVQPVEPELTRALLERGLAGWVIRHGSTVALPDVSRDRRWLQFSEQHQSGCVMVLPIRQARATLGALTVHRSLPHAFSGHDLLLLEGVAAQLGVALAGAQHYHNERRRRDQMLALFALSQYLATERSNAELAATIQERSVAIFDVDYGLLFVRGAGDRLAPAELPRVLREPTGAVVLERGAQAARRAWVQRQTITEGGCAALPLTAHGRRQGALVLIRTAPDEMAFAVDTLSLLCVFGQLIAGA
jgi:GAF domain-containing protein